MSTRVIFFSFVLSSLIWFRSVSADVYFLSIDCGSSDTSSYKDDNLITWSGDQDYVQNGESRRVPPRNSISNVIDTLRVFTTRMKNCYFINSIPKGRVLLRVSFYYGNYDGKNNPPSFDLSFDGNYWATVNDPDYVFYEVIYVVKNDFISVCVEQKNAGEFPFISAIEVRGLESTMYNQIPDDYPLFVVSRAAYGANKTIRYIDDPYDRIWFPSTPGNGLTTISSGPFLNSIAGFNDNPPPRVLQNAITAIDPNTTINLNLPFPNISIPIYITMYFSEVTKLKPNQTRSFRVFKDNRPFSSPVIPISGNFTELYASNVTVYPNTSISLVPTNVSTLPPLINALELFWVGSVLVDGTYDKDVKGLAILQKSFDVLQEWTGDPCLPSPYSWDWIDCRGESTPRVIALFLSGFNLSGKLPDFSSMDALVTVDLHNNSLTGPIPEFLGSLPTLRSLNLADNHFNGSIPTSLLRKKGLNLVVDGNPDLCTSVKPCASPTPTSSIGSPKKNNALLIQAIILCLIISCIIIY